MVLSRIENFDSLYIVFIWKMLNRFFDLKGDIRTKNWSCHFVAEVLTLCELGRVKPTVQHLKLLLLLYVETTLPPWEVYYVK